jgi:hypothetical protein
MAVPTITDVSPDSGITSGLNLVKITGTNFNPPATLDPETFPQGAEPYSVKVTVDGYDADSLYCISGDVCWVVMPEYLGLSGDLPKDVDVVLSNLDSDGNVVAGETVTATDAYTYKRQSVADDAEGALIWVTENLIDYMARHIVDNVALTTDPDYSDNPSAGIAALATLPGVVLVGPRISDDPMRKGQHPAETAISGDPISHYVEHPHEPKIMEFDIHAFGRTKKEALNLTELIDNTLRARPRLRILDYRGGSDTIDLTMYLSSPWDGVDAMSGSFSRRGSTTLRIEGVFLRTAHGVQPTPQVLPDQGIAFEAGDDAADITLTDR